MGIVSAPAGARRHGARDEAERQAAGLRGDELDRESLTKDPAQLAEAVLERHVKRRRARVHADRDNDDAPQAWRWLRLGRERRAKDGEGEKNEVRLTALNLIAPTLSHEGQSLNDPRVRAHS